MTLDALIRWQRFLATYDAAPLDAVLGALEDAGPALGRRRLRREDSVGLDEAELGYFAEEDDVPDDGREEVDVHADTKSEAGGGRAGAARPAHDAADRGEG